MTRTPEAAAGGNTRARQLAARREQFVVAAERLFLTHGYADTSVNAIVREAGGSLATLYAEFGTKEALFESVLSQRASGFFPATRPRPGKGGPEAQLRTLAARMLQRMLSEDGLAMYRIAVHEGPRFAALRKTLLESGMSGFQERTASYLADLAATHSLRIDDAHLAARRFIALAQGQLVFAAACGGKVDSAMRTRQVNEAVEAFLRLYAER